MRQRSHQPKFAWLICILSNFVNLAPSWRVLFFAPFARFAVKSSPPTPGSGQPHRAAPTIYVLFVDKSLVPVNCDTVTCFWVAATNATNGKVEILFVGPHPDGLS
jgi:hypothetical protein